MTNESVTILSVHVADTDPRALAIQVKLRKEMSGEQLLVLAFRMSEFARELTKEGIRNDHPDWPEQRVLGEIIRLALLPAPLPPRLR